MIDFNSKYTGAEAEELLDLASTRASQEDLNLAIERIDDLSSEKQDMITDLDTIRANAAKGATALQSVPSEYVTESELTSKGYATTTQLSGKQDTISDLATIRSGAALGATALQTETYKGTVTGVKINGTTKNPSSGVVDLGTVITSHQDISGKADKSSLATVATSGSYNDLSNKPTIPAAVTESTVSGWGFTKNAGTVTGVKINGTTKSPSSGVVDLGTVITSHQDISGKQDKLVSGTNIKTINNTSILGSGNISITGGSGTITGVSANGTSIATSGVANIPAATTSKYGVTQLSSSTSSTSTSLAATPSAVKAAYDLANGKQDKLVSGTNIKTINGTSILGSGDITISGGSSSGSGAYAEVNHGTSDTAFTLTPNTFHVWGEVSELTLTLGDETAGVANEFLFQFTSGSTPTSLTLPDDIKWANDSAPTIAENKIYQVSILKGLASVLEFSNAIVFPVIGSTNGLDNEEYAKVYEYFVNTYNLTSTSASPSNGVAITETLICNNPYFGGSVLKVSLNGTRLLLWTQKAIDTITVPSITNLGRYLDYTFD